MGTEIRYQLVGQHCHHVDTEATGMLTVILNGLEQLGLGLFAESGQLGSLSLLANPLEVLHGGDSQLVMKCLDFLGSQSLQLEQLENSLGEGGLQLLVVFQTTRGHQFGDLLRDSLADPLDFSETAFRDDFLDRHAQRLQSPGRIRVGADFERILALQL